MNPNKLLAKASQLLRATAQVLSRWSKNKFQIKKENQYRFQQPLMTASDVSVKVQQLIELFRCQIQPTVLELGVHALKLISLREQFDEYEANEDLSRLTLQKDNASTTSSCVTAQMSDFMETGFTILLQVQQLNNQERESCSHFIHAGIQLLHRQVPDFKGGRPGVKCLGLLHAARDHSGYDPFPDYKLKLYETLYDLVQELKQFAQRAPLSTEVVNALETDRQFLDDVKEAARNVHLLQSDPGDKRLTRHCIAAFCRIARKINLIPGKEKGDVGGADADKTTVRLHQVREELEEMRDSFSEQGHSQRRWRAATPRHSPHIPVDDNDDDH